MFDLCCSESVEPKLCLLYSMFFSLCYQHLIHHGDQRGVALRMMTFVDILDDVLRTSYSRWNMLQLMALTSSYSMSERLRVLLLSLIVFVRSNVHVSGEEVVIR